MTLDLLDKILIEGCVEDESGTNHILHSHTSPEQLKFLNAIIEEKMATRGLEIGLGYGVSTLQIARSLNNVSTEFTHIVIDPYQSEWNDIGKLNIARSGYKNIKLFEQRSDEVLPVLANEALNFDFVYIDSTKIFDVLLVDIHFITKMLKTGGVLVLDDCDFPGIRLLARFLAKHPSYRLLKGFNKEKISVFGRLADFLISCYMSFIPFRRTRVKRIEVSTDRQLGVDFKCIAFEKKSDDTRSWSWFEPF